jgi:hypothetical protein
VISNDGVVRYQNRLVQVKNQGRRTAPPQARVAVCEWEDGRLEIRYRGQALVWEEIQQRRQPARHPDKAVVAVCSPRRPPADHPWRKPIWGTRLDPAVGVAPRLAEDSTSAPP